MPHAYRVALAVGIFTVTVTTIRAQDQDASRVQPQQSEPSAKPYDPVSVDPRPFARLLLQRTRYRVEQTLGQPAVVNPDHHEWYYQLPRSQGWLRISFTPDGRVKSTKTVHAPRADGPGKWATALAAGATVLLAGECAHVAGKPVLWMTYDDWQWVQACQAAGMLP
jgi:hypothetical protein